MELRGHNLIIISLDSHFSKMESNVLTRRPLPRLPPSPLPRPWNNSGGQRWFTAAVSQDSHWPVPIMLSARGGSPAQSLETSAQISAKCLSNQVCNPGKFSKNNPAVSLASRSWRGQVINTV